MSLHTQTMRVRTDEIRTCPECGELVKTIVSRGVAGTFRMTSHVNAERDEAKRCKYDGGPYAGGRALEPFPGDTVP